MICNVVRQLVNICQRLCSLRAYQCVAMNCHAKFWEFWNHGRVTGYMLLESFRTLCTLTSLTLWQNLTCRSLWARRVRKTDRIRPCSPCSLTLQGVNETRMAAMAAMVAMSRYTLSWSATNEMKMTHGSLDLKQQLCTEAKPQKWSRKFRQKPLELKANMEGAALDNDGQSGMGPVCNLTKMYLWMKCRFLQVEQSDRAAASGGSFGSLVQIMQDEKHWNASIWCCNTCCVAIVHLTPFVSDFVILWFHLIPFDSTWFGRSRCFWRRCTTFQLPATGRSSRRQNRHCGFALVGDCCNCFGQSQLWRNGRNESRWAVGAEERNQWDDWDECNRREEANSEWCVTWR